MKKSIQVWKFGKKARPLLLEGLNKRLLRTPLSGHRRRWQLLHKLACDPYLQKD
ncbi:hypothetical protein [Sedimenticola sp.]|uniref:hypothetical protein n=1 Tax=Sedimenticola sp. TaxID=1940285 RepID=UPI003D1440A1